MASLFYFLCNNDINLTTNDTIFTQLVIILLIREIYIEYHNTNIHIIGRVRSDCGLQFGLALHSLRLALCDGQHIDELYVYFQICFKHFF